MKIDVAHIRRMADAIATTDDHETEPGFLDTLDGETDVADIADYLIAEILQDEALADAADAQATALKSRSSRLRVRAKTKRKVAVDLLDASGLRKLERPQATISRVAGRVSVEIVDEEAIPTQLRREKIEVMPDKAAIKAHLEAGVDVPGAELVRGQDTLSMRAV